MRILKLIIISAIILFALLTALSLLLPRHVRISRAINISSSREKIVPYLGDLREWKSWNRFVIVPDSMKQLQVLSDTLVQSDRFNIRMVRKSTDTIETSWIQPGGTVSTGSFALMPGEHYTVVQWYFDFYLEWYPWQKFQSIIYDKQLGGPMEISLQQLKQKIELSQ